MWLGMLQDVARDVVNSVRSDVINVMKVVQELEESLMERFIFSACNQ